MAIVGAIALIGLVVYIWDTIPPEDPEIIEARKRYGTVKEK